MYIPIRLLGVLLGVSHPAGVPLPALTSKLQALYRPRTSPQIRNRLRSFLLVILFSVLAFVVMGYHPGSEDDAVYLTAVKHDLAPKLYPRDAPFFEVQLQATAFDKVIAESIELTTVSVAWGELVWQGLTILLIVASAFLIIRQIIPNPLAQWAGVALLTAMFTLPVAGTALYIVDQHLHPRNIATAFILLGVSRVMARQYWLAAPLLIISFLLHPIMGAMGMSFCFFLALAQMAFVRARVREISESRVLTRAAAAAMPLGWMFSPPTDTWRKALSTRTYYFLYQWEWYEWLGAIAPLALFWLLARWAQKRGDKRMAQFAWGVLAFGVFQQVLAMIITGPDSLIRLIPLQPMRYLHLVYIVMTLVGGALIGQYLLKTKVWRWAVFLLLINIGMFISQRQLFAGTEHLEMPGAKSGNPWLQAFDWVRVNTPQDAYFAMDPHYMAQPFEDFYSFRALGERSMLTDALKDSAVTTQVPDLAIIWDEQQKAQAGWTQFKLADFQRLKAHYGVNWALVAFPAPAGLSCKWHNEILAACEIP